jgi:spermidine synthase
MEHSMSGKNTESAHFLIMLLVVLGAQTMIVELTIPRLIAPVFGNTLFSWTAIIAVVLASLAIGYQLGGIMSSNCDLRRLIYGFSFGSSVWVVLLSITGHWTVNQLDWAGIMQGPLLAATILAAVPAAMAAAVVPLVVQSISDSSGSASGRCFAWSTVGSILGVIATGYFLLPNLGIFGTLLVGPGLVFAVILLGRNWYPGIAGSTLLILIILVPIYEPAHNVVIDKSNGFHRIQVFEVGDLKYLKLDSTIEGAIRVGHDIPVLKYQRSIMPIANLVHPLRSALFLGGGSFSMPRYIKHVFPGVTVSAVEIDKDVVEIARKHLELSTAIQVHLGDGRRELATSDKNFDLIVNDAFNGVRKIPFHLVTKEFNDLVKSKLTNHGVYAINVIGHSIKGKLVDSVTATLLTTFSHVSNYNYSGSSKATNNWILASSKPVNIGDEPLQSEDKKNILTDNNAPIEYLIASEILSGM